MKSNLNVSILCLPLLIHHNISVSGQTMDWLESWIGSMEQIANNQKRKEINNNSLIENGKSFLSCLVCLYIDNSINLNQNEMN